MKYTIGYQLPDEYDSTLSICKDYKENISGVYFSYGSEPSGRLPLFFSGDEDEDEIKKFQLEELKAINSLGIPLSLLLNANCYGEEAVSDGFKEHILTLVRFLKNEVNISAVTTTSPFVAETLKNEFGDSLYICASVNMRVDNINTMRQLSDSFDGFYIRKELNRNLEGIKQLHSWCSENGKKLLILANSGCLSYCGFQTFHDNLVAHQNGLTDSTYLKYPAPCWKYLDSLSEDDMLSAIMQSNWIRPEDVWRYEEYFPEMKLATRMHSRPRMVIAAYIRERFKGNITDLTEPSYSSLFRGKILDNTLLKDEWFDMVSKCDKNCHKCDYCKTTVQKIKIKV